MKLPLDAPKFKLAAVSVPRNAREARERARRSRESTPERDARMPKDDATRLPSAERERR